MNNELALEITKLCDTLYENNLEVGWWDINQNPLDRVPEKLCLIHSEVSEALEGDRKNLQDSHLPHRKAFEVELADAVIRIFDLAGATGLDLGMAMKEKLEYNKTRADHKRENRNKIGGKLY